MVENKQFRGKRNHNLQFGGGLTMGKENYKKITKEESFRIAKMIWKNWMESETEIWFFGYVGVPNYCIGYCHQSPLPARDAKGNKSWSVSGNDGEIRRIDNPAAGADKDWKDLVDGKLEWELAEKIQAGYGWQEA